jgi:hypothetical protein
MTSIIITHYQASHVSLGQDGSIAQCRLLVYMSSTPHDKGSYLLETGML